MMNKNIQSCTRLAMVKGWMFSTNIEVRVNIVNQLNLDSA